MERGKRQSNFELLRIISMLMIILHHYSYHGGSFNLEPGAAKSISQLFFIGGSLGVNIFMLISSYFIIGTKFSLKRLLKIMAEVWFYTIGIAFVCNIAKLGTYNYRTWLSCLMPFVFNGSWFAISYVFVYLISPFLNKLINSLSKRQYTVLLFVLFVFFTAIPTITLPSTQRVCFNLVSWFVVLYILAGYIRRFSIKFFEKKTVSAAVLILSVAVIWGSMILFTGLGEKNEFFKGVITYYTNHDTLFMVLAAVSVFMLFKNLNMGSNKQINFLAQTSFGVYLIHDQIMLRNTIWHSWLNCQNIKTPVYLLFHGIVSAVLIYAAASVIDRIRIEFIEKPLFSINKFDKKFEKFDKMMNDER